VSDNQVPVRVQNVVLAKYRDGRLELVATTATGATPPWISVWHASQNKPGGEVWEGWESLGNPPGGVSLDTNRTVTIACNADDRLEVATLSRNGDAWHAWQHHPGRDWTGWRSLGTPPGRADSIGCPVLAVNKGGRLELFMLRRDVSTNGVWHRGQQTPGGDWSAWSSLDAPAGDPIIEDGLEVARNGDGRLEVFASAGEVWHRGQKTPGGDWSDWSSLGAPPHGLSPNIAPLVARNKDGRLEVFMNLFDGVWHRWQQTPGGDWSDWTPLGRPDPEDRVASIAVAPNADGRLLLVANPAGTGLVPTTPTTTTPPPASSHSLWQRTQQFPGDSNIDWRSWSPLVSTPGIGALRLASDPIQRLHLFGALASGAGAFLASQTAVNGSHWASSTWPPPPDEIGLPPDL
jgi:hypothetical protein